MRGVSCGRCGGRSGATSGMGDGVTRLGNAIRLFRASADAVPPGAPRPSMTMWYDPGGVRPPVQWAPVSGEFSTLWDWQACLVLGIPAVWRARMLISQSIGGMPVAAWRGAEQVDPLPVVLREPCPGEDRANTVAAWVCDLLDHGNAFGVITDTNAELKAISVQPYPASWVSVGRRDNGSVVYTVQNPDSGVSEAFDQSRVFHARGTTLPGALRGVGVLEAGLNALDRMTAEGSYAARAFSSGVPSGLLKVRDPDLQPGSDDDPPGFTTAKGIK